MLTIWRWMWGIIGLALILVGLFIPYLGWILKIFGAAIIIAVELPVVAPLLIKLVDWLEKKTGWKIHEKILRITSWLKIFGIKPKK